MALSTVQTLEEALKTLYLEPLIKTIDTGSGPVFAKIDKNSKNVVGEDIKFALQYGRHGGIGARGESDDLPVPSPRKYKQGVTSTKNLYGRISFSEKLMKISKNNAASFADQVSTQMEDITVDIRDMMRRNFMGKSDGIMGQVKTQVTAGKNVVVKGKVKTFYAGQIVDFFTLSGTAQTKTAEAKMIVDVDYATNTISFADNVTVGANDYISLAGNYGKELIGLKEILTKDSTIYGIDRSKNKWYNPLVFDKTSSSATTAFSSMYLQEAIDEIEDYTGEKPDFITCNAGMLRAYINEQNTYKRNIEYTKIDGGVELVSYGKVPISKEKYMDDNTIYLINTKDLTLAQVADWGWMDADGSILSRVAEKAAYEATLTKYAELICRRPSAQAIITGITAA